MYSTTTRYQELTAQATRRGSGPGCGKPTIRSRTFTMTINPFNRNPDGTVRTPGEVLDAVSAKAAAWQPEEELFRHQKCEPR